MIEGDYLLEDKRQILTAALPHVPFDGWSDKLLLEATRATGHAADVAARAFPRGPLDLLDFYMREADRTMLAALEQADLAGMKIRDKIAFAIRSRLEQQTNHREAVRRGLAFLALPQNAVLGIAGTYRTVDAIWYGIGDTSTDFSFYSKRLLLAGVYSTTLLHWLDDKSENFSSTWTFLDRRISDVLRIQKVRGRIERAVGNLPNPFRILGRR